MLPLPGFADPSASLPPPPTLLDTAASIGGLTLRNRVAMAAMTTGFASPSGRVTPRLLAWYGARAAGGPALVIVEETYVLDDDRSRAVRPRHLFLAGPEALPGLRRLAGAIHAGGALAALQLGYPRLPDLDATSGAEIAQIVRAFGMAAQRARDAGFDTIQLQAIPSRFLGQLLSPLQNHRRDTYGRGPAGRLRALLDAVGAARDAGLPILVKFSADERNPRGITLETAAEIARALEAAGAAGIEVVGGASSNPPTEPLSHGGGEATRADLSAAVKAAVTIPVLASGRIVSADSAEGTLRRREADAVSVGRALLADPGWVAKHRAGIEDEIVPCIACMACFTPAPHGGTGCPVNGDAGREHLPPLELAATPRRITILGANLPALELARVAATRGHRVTITTAGLPLGGLLGLRAGVPGNAEFGRAFLYFGDRLRELSAFLVDKPDPQADVTIDCRAAPERRVPWHSDKGALLAGDLLGRDLHEMFGVGRRVAVVGEGAMAAEVALFLGGWGRRSTVVVPGAAENPFPDVHPTHAARLLERLEGYKVPVVTGATVRRWAYDEDRKSRLHVLRDAKEDVLEPFHTAVSALGWNAVTPWPQRVRLPRVPQDVPPGTTIHLGDTIYPEPLRDMVAYANLLGRVI